MRFWFRRLTPQASNEALNAVEESKKAKMKAIVLAQEGVEIKDLLITEQQLNSFTKLFRQALGG